MDRSIKEGTKVYYSPSHGSKENGIVKSINDEYAFVVYKCACEWNNYRNYTGARTDLKDLQYGWVDENGSLLKEYCDHHYIPTNAKWQPINQSRCCFCGDTID